MIAIMRIITFLRIVVCFRRLSQTAWTLCQFLQTLRYGANPEHTKLNLAWPWNLHDQYPAVEPSRGPIGDCFAGTGCSRPLHAIVLGVSQHQILQSKMALALIWVFHFQSHKQSIDQQIMTIISITSKIANETKQKFRQWIVYWLLLA